jgi:hypothetical protein
LSSANVGAKCILLIIAIVPLSDCHEFEVGAHFNTKKIVA